MYKQLALFIALLGISETIFAQTVHPDSLMAYLVKNEGTLKSMLGHYESVAFNWKQFLFTIGGFLFFLGAAWKFWVKDALTTFVKTKTQAVIAEMNNYKKAHILVVSSALGKNAQNDDFLRSYFEDQEFPNVEYLAIEDAHRPAASKPYDLLFINNDDSLIDKDIARTYITSNAMVFYLGKTASWEFAKDTPDLSRRINFANSRAQIHGNLESSLEFRAKALPKYNNV